MIIVAESGATKTEWRSVGNDGTVRPAQTPGMNPSSYDEDHIASAVAQAISAVNPEGEKVDRIFFYGAGLVSTASVAPVGDALQKWCPDAFMDFRNDLVAAARALFGDQEGVVAIMGTGSNSCFYRDGKIVLNYRPGGFILGDEGSAAHLGKTFMSDLIKGRVSSEAERIFREDYDLSYQEIVENVYRRPGAAAFLGSFAPFILKNVDEPSGYMRSLLEGCIDSFMQTALNRYKENYGVNKVGVVGSFGCACEDLVRETGSRYGLEFVKFIKSPIEELVKYHGL